MLAIPALGAGLYALFIVFVGYAHIYWLSLAIALAILFSNFLKKNLGPGFVKATLFLSLFDNSLLNPTIGEIPLRLSFLISPFLTAYAILGFRLRMGRKTLQLTICLGLLLSLHILFISLSDGAGSLYGVKYLLFTFFPMAAISYLTHKTGKFEDIVTYSIRLGVFICIFSFLQMATIRSYNFILQPQVIDLYPSAFFSERTWYGMYMAFSFQLLFFALNFRNKILKQSEFLICLGLFSTGIVISLSRNALLASAIFSAGYLLLVVGRLSSRQFMVLFKTFVGYFTLAILLAGIAIAAQGEFANKLIDLLSDSVGTTIQAFRDGNQSSSGRLEAMEMTLERYFNGEYSILGNGFDWDYERDVSPVGGTAIGAKSANLFAFVFHIYGIPGLALLLLAALSLYNIATVSGGAIKSTLVLLSLVSWVIMAQFAPLHQYGTSTLLLGLLVGILMSDDRKAVSIPVGRMIQKRWKAINATDI